MLVVVDPAVSVAYVNFSMVLTVVGVDAGATPPAKYPDVLDVPGAGAGDGAGAAVFDDMSRR